MSTDFWIGFAIALPAISVSVALLVAAKWVNESLNEEVFKRVRRVKRVYDRPRLIKGRARLVRKCLTFSHGFGFQILGVGVLVVLGSLDPDEKRHGDNAKETKA